ncbi:MAG: hypothetical protein FWF31_11015 [Desulfobulbus sp.]|nr:hypothetical protein [Desulfobulbus sp.]
MIGLQFLVIFDATEEADGKPSVGHALQPFGKHFHPTTAPWSPIVWSERTEWLGGEEGFGELYSEEGRPGIPISMMVGLT